MLLANTFANYVSEARTSPIKFTSRYVRAGTIYASILFLSHTISTAFFNHLEDLTHSIQSIQVYMSFISSISFH